jgi:hypothetical protein
MITGQESYECVWSTHKLNSVAFVRERTIPTERPPLVCEVVPTFVDRGCCVVSATDSRGRQSWFSRPEPLLFLQIAPQLSSRGWVDPVPDPLLLRKSGSAGNRTKDLWICSQKLWPLDHRGGRSTHSRSNLRKNYWTVCVPQTMLHEYFM